MKKLTVIVYKNIFYKKYRIVTRKFQTKQIGYWLTDDDDEKKKLEIAGNVER
ncbi:MAG TPA: hypothetical protein VJ767_06025 [Nitrososphaeraceae archaeon]|nr:hypothetical protein [Nitrososphaeraceae archaeon]